MLPTFTLSEMTSNAVIAENVIKEDMYEAAAEVLVEDGIVDSPAGVFFSTVKFEGDKSSAFQHFVAYTYDGYVRMFKYSPYVKKPAKSKGKEEFDLAAYIAGLTPEQRKALAAMAAGEGQEG